MLSTHIQMHTALRRDVCRMCEWAWCPAQAFVDILATNETFSAPMDTTYSLLGLSPNDVTTLEQYLQVCAHAASAGQDW